MSSRWRLFDQKCTFLQRGKSFFVSAISFPECICLLLFAELWISYRPKEREFEFWNISLLSFLLFYAQYILSTFTPIIDFNFSRNLTFAPLSISFFKTAKFTRVSYFRISYPIYVFFQAAHDGLWRLGRWKIGLSCFICAFFPFPFFSIFIISPSRDPLFIFSYQHIRFYSLSLTTAPSSGGFLTFLPHFSFSLF